ncbi:MAG: T9SS type A sorting domain-containing protein [Flavobacteriaceae bacterium]|nr:T9SS type A sorting domain-containing protein [Flavobacteriaceae bacterium]
MRKQLLTFLTIASAFAMNAQVTLLKDINSGTGNSLPSELTLFNNKLYFGGDDATGTNSPGSVDLGKELWATDGTSGGTVFIKDLRSGSASSSPSFFFNYNGSLYFSANTGSGNVLHVTDGTESGTLATGGGFVFNPIELNGLIYYIVTTDSNGLYEFNGTTQVKVANVGTEDVNFIGAAFTALNNKIIGYGFTATDDPTVGRELYEYNPATDAYTLIKDITGDATDSGISNFVVLNSEVYFEALDVLWKTDGTTVGTNAVSAAASLTGVTSLFEWNGKLYFEGDTGTSGDQLWVYDPVGDTITNISNITGGTINDHNPSDYASLNGHLYYAGQVADNSLKYLFRTDGTITERISSTIFDIDDIAVLNGKLYFEGDDGTTGNELYSLDPTTLSIGSNVKEIINVFPNPATDYITVSKNLLNASYSIYESTGKLVKEGIITSEKIQLNLTSGLYFVKIKTENSLVTKKIIVK